MAPNPDGPLKPQVLWRQAVRSIQQAHRKKSARTMGKALNPMVGFRMMSAWPANVMQARPKWKIPVLAAAILDAPQRTA